MSKAPPPGVYVPAVVFYDEKEDLDFPSIKAHILRLAQGNVTGILVQGSNGEAQHLSHEERRKTIDFTRKTLDDNGFQDVLVIAGTGAQSLRETIQLCIAAKEAGASHALVLTPSVWPKMMTPDNVVRFHTQVADASPIPTMIYNFPTVTAGQDLDSDILAALANHPNIVGVKLSCGNIGKLHRLTSRFSPSDFAVYSGKSDTMLFGALAGGAGGIVALGNIVPKLHAHMWKLFEERKVDEAMALQAKLGHGDWAISKIGGISGVKAVIAANFEYGNPRVRAPLQPVLLGDTLSFIVEALYQTLLDLIRLEKAL